MTSRNLSIASPQAPVSAEQPWVGTRFSAHDSDIEVQSSDGFIFQLHRRALEVSTGAFPGSEIDTHGDVVHLSEPARVLGILFAFVYPRKFVDLDGEAFEFEVVRDVAEAAEKYEVFGAMYACAVRMRELLPTHAAEIFTFAIQYDYPKLINDAVPYLARAPYIPTLAKFPPAYIIPWAKYTQAWCSIFKDAQSDLLKQPIEASSSMCHVPPSRVTAPPTKICGVCLKSAITVLNQLELIDSLAALQDTLRAPRATFGDMPCCHREGYALQVCPHVLWLVAFCRERVKRVPDFLSFVHGKA